MSARPTDEDDYVTLGVDAQARDRYADVTLDDGAVLIYDRENEDAWFQSESAMPLDAMA